METDAIVAPIEVRIGQGEEIKIEAGPAAREALRRDALRELIDASEAIQASNEAMPAMDDPTVRAELESLAIALRQATRACDALWYLAPEYDDGEPV